MTTMVNEVDSDIEALWPDRTPRIYIDVTSVNAARILSELPFEIVESAYEADLLWMRFRYHRWYKRLTALQAINHIPLEGCMIRKADLAQTLHRYGAAQSQNDFSHADFVQPTYRLSDPQEMAAFVAQLPQKDHPENLWILKPSNLSSGEGIRIVWDFAWLRKALRKHGHIGFLHDGQAFDYVAQRYIKNVLLLNGKKSEIRIYWLIASLDPLLVLMYPEGLTRLTVQPYKLDDFDNPLIHIIRGNEQGQHDGDNPDAVLDWSFLQLREYLTKEKGTPDDYFDRTLRPKLRQSLAYVVRASVEILKRTPSSGLFFGLYGADFILDDQLTPWLTEIQKGPSLVVDHPKKEQLKHPMLQGAVSIVLEIMGSKRNGKALTALSTTRGYEWVIGEPASD